MAFFSALKGSGARFAEGGQRSHLHGPMGPSRLVGVSLASQGGGGKWAGNRNRTRGSRHSRGRWLPWTPRSCATHPASATSEGKIRAATAGFLGRVDKELGEIRERRIVSVRGLEESACRAGLGRQQCSHIWREVGRGVPSPIWVTGVDA